VKLPSLLSKYKLQIWIGLAILFTAISLIWLPYWRVSQFEINKATENATLENQYRATLAQIFGGVAVAIGIYSAWKNIKIAQDTLEFNQKNAEDNLKVYQEGQITERFTRAIEQLGNEKIEIRLGGIYALERISSESEKDYWPIMKILAAYIREKSKENIVTENYEQQEKDKPLSTDFQVILDLIYKREHSLNEKLDLQNSNLRNVRLYVSNLKGAQLRKAHLEGADLQGSHLEGADLFGAHLEGAALTETHLEGANLEEAHLEGADLQGSHLEGANLMAANLFGANLGGVFLLRDANLEGANLEGAQLRGANFFEEHLEVAHLEGANLQGTHLEEANLLGAHLEGANLLGTHLEGANLQGTHLEDADLLGTNLEDADLFGAHLEGANLLGAHLERAYLVEAHLKGAYLEGANLFGANLFGAENLTVDQLSNVKTLYKAKLDDELEKPLREKYPALFEKTDD